MPAQNDIEMQYKPAEPMQARQGATTENNNTQQQEGAVEQKKTILGMRGGGLILDLCACFICCECMDGCVHAIDDCCCC